MSEQLIQGIVRILNVNRDTAGTGFVISESGLIATCSHVIQNDELQKDSFPLPEKVTILFHATGEERDAWTKPDWWLPWNAGDLAILQVEGMLPQGVQPLPLGSALGTEEHKVSTFGFPNLDSDGDDIEGLGADGIVVSVLRDAGRVILQLRSGEITVGFSGAPIWDKLGRCVIGVVSAITEPDHHNRLKETAFAIATEMLRDVCPALQLSEVCPYHGLTAFTEADTEFFFGRQQVVEGLLNRLQHDPRFLVVLGPSGCGKSSIVQAGLIPQLRNGRVPSSDRWGIIVTRPATQPFDKLLKQGLVDEVYDVEAWLSQNTEQERLTLVIDQFEELLLPICPESVRQDFVTQLVKLLHSPLPITVVLIMRADFYSRLTEQEALMEWLERNRGPVHVPKILKQDELIAIVQKPAEAVGLRCEDGLIETIVKDSLEIAVEFEDGKQAGRSTVLPLLEFAMTELWKLRDERMLTHKAYRTIGGVTGALTQWADRAFYALKQGERQLAQRNLTDLVYVGDEDQGILDSRRRRTQASLCRNESEQESVQAVIRHLVENHLLATGRDLQSNEETVEIIHEVLLREWGELKDWLEADRRFLHWHQELERRALAWVETNTANSVERDLSKLLGGSDLTKASKWLKIRRTDLSQNECDFIQASKERHARIRRYIVLGSVLGIPLLTAAGFRVEQIMRPPSVITKTEPPPITFPYSYTGHTAAVNSVAWSPDGTRIASASLDGTVQVWDASRGNTLLTYRGHTAAVNSVAWSPDGKYLAMASIDGTVRVWDVSHGTRLLTYKGHTAAVNSVDWSPDGKYIASASLDRTVRVWDVSHGTRLLTYKGHTAAVNSVDWSPDGKYLASASLDRTAQVWDASRGNTLLTYRGHTAAVTCVAWSPDGKYLASGAGDANPYKTAQVWDASSGTCLLTYTGHSDAVTCVAWSPDGKYIASANADFTVQVWPAGSGALLLTYRGHSDAVTCVAWSPNGEQLASASIDYSVQVWDASRGNTLFTYRGHSNAVTCVAWSPDGKRIVSASDDETVQVWDANSTMTRLLTYRGHSDVVSSAAWSPDGTRIASACQDETVQVWDASKGTQRLTYRGHSDIVNSVAWSPDGTRIASASDDETVQVWDASSGTCLLTYRGHSDVVKSAAWSPDGKRIVSASDDETVQIWDADSGMHLLTYTGQDLITYSNNTYAVTGAVWSLDGKRIASTGEDGTIQVWDASSGTHLFTYAGHMMIQGRMIPDIIVSTLAWSPDGYHIASASDETVQVWFIL